MCFVVVVEVAWDRAEEESRASGNPFNDRNGKRCNVEHEQIGVVEIVAAVVLGAGVGLRRGSEDAVAVRAGRAC